ERGRRRRRVDDAQKSLPGRSAGLPAPLASVVAANAVCGAVIGFCVPTWYRMPQTMTVDYRSWNIEIAARTGDAGRVRTTTQIAAPTATAIGTTLVSKNGHLMAEEAIADAMGQARCYIDRAHDDARGCPPTPARSSPASA